MWQVYKQISEENQIVIKRWIPRVKSIVSPQGDCKFDDNLAEHAIRTIVERSNIGCCLTSKEPQLEKLFSKEAILDAILFIALREIKGLVFRQKNWIEYDDVTKIPADVTFRQEFLGKLSDMLYQKCEATNIDDRIQFQLNQIQALTCTIESSKTNSCLTDGRSLSNKDIFISFVQLFAMMTFGYLHLYHNGAISNKCAIQNPVRTLWSGLSLNDVHRIELFNAAKKLTELHDMVTEIKNTPDEDGYRYLRSPAYR